MVSWRKKLHQLNTADLYANLEILTAKLLHNYKKQINVTFYVVWLSIKGQENKIKGYTGNSISLHMNTT